MKKGKIAPATVYYGGIPMPFVQSLTNSYRALSNLGELIANTSSTPNRARTKNGYEFLKSDAEWLLLLDTDMIWEPQAIIQLSKTAKQTGAKLVAGLAFMEIKGRIMPNCFTYQKGSYRPYATLPSEDRSFPVDAVGGSCLLIHREVYYAIAERNKGTTEYLWQEELYNEVDDIQMGEDIVFSERANEAGFEIIYEPRALFFHGFKDRVIGPMEYKAYLQRSGI